MIMSFMFIYVYNQYVQFLITATYDNIYPIH